jgi:uncharacterized protein (DUF1697 family)
MADLRSLLTAAGLAEVRTYIQSGNVVFETSGGSASESSLATTISDAVAAGVGLRVPVVVRTFDDIARIADSHPDSGGSVPPKWLHVFLLDRVADPGRLPDPARYAPDVATVDGREIYVTYPTGAGRSTLTIELMERAFGVTATARNLSTLTKIRSL